MQSISNIKKTPLINRISETEFTKIKVTCIKTPYASRRRHNNYFYYFCLAMTGLSILTLVVLMGHVISEGIDWVDFEFLNRYPSRFPHKAGIKSGLWGTLWLISLTASISVPIAICSALYLEEYTRNGKIGKWIEINITNLAGVPSIVYGLLGLTLFVRTFELGNSLLAGALSLSLLIMPIIIVASRAAIRAVPDAIPMAAYAVGARRYQVVFGQILPVAIPGILTGVILALSRAIGETAPLVIIGALTYVSYTPESVMDEFTVLPLQIYNWASRPQEGFHSLAAAGIIVLLAVMLCMNAIAVTIRQRSQKRNQL